MKSVDQTVPAHGSQSALTWMNADAFVFDIDGTLLVTRDLVHWNALHQAMLEAYGVDTTIEGIPYHGKTDLSILRAAVTRAGISEAEFERHRPKALEVVCREVSCRAGQIVAETCPAITELLQVLATKGKLIGIASGNLEAVGWHKIQAAGLRRSFQFGCFSDQWESRTDIFRGAVAAVRSRLGPDATACFIGDTPSDISAAAEIQAPIIAIGSGTFSQQELSTHSPDYCFPSCAELLQFE